MEKIKWAAISGLVIGTFTLARSIPSTFAFDKPTHTSIVLLASCAATILGLGRLLPNDGGKSHRDQQYDALPLEDIGPHSSPRESFSAGEDWRYPPSLRTLRIFFLVLVATICLRVEAWREIVGHSQCATATTNWEPLIPFAFALWDFWAVQRHNRRVASEDPDISAYEAVGDYLTYASYRYVLATGLLGCGGIIALSAATAPPSTYICAAWLPHRWWIPLVQRLCTFLDFIIAYCIERLLHQQEGRGARGVRLRFTSVGWACLFSAVILSIIGVVYFIASADDREWIQTIPSVYVWDVVKLDAWACFTAACTLLSIYHAGLMSTLVMATFVAVSTVVISFVWSNPHPFPPFSGGLSFVAACFMIFGFAAYLYVESISEEKTPGSRSPTFSRVPFALYFLLLILLCFHIGIWASRSSRVTYHPIDYLIFDAQSRHTAFESGASASQSLDEAVQIYRDRYGRHPPPGFQHWYKYATSRGSVIIDDYDSISRDLLPFWALSAEEIRQRTWTMISNPWNDAAGISVRNGEVTISPNVMLTHRWMLDGVVEMITKFAEHLPDMDLAFNLNDESRVTVPYEVIEPMKKAGATFSGLDKTPENQFSAGRAAQWQPIPAEPNDETPLKAISFHPSFDEFGRVGCPPNSPARTQRIWDVSALCTTCASPHSLGVFLANWTVAADICHQPDLAKLHGLYISPAAYKGTHVLYPIFSQSKAHGFNDILYPSAWNYIDKARYAPSAEHLDIPYHDKADTLFWRGATSEGVSPGMGQWKGMARQRFVHNAQNINDTNSPSALLLPTKPGSHKLKYMQVPNSDLTRLLSVDVHIVDSIARCGGRDCTHQAHEFAPLVPPTEFQDHWRFKFLLDLDGAGFSGRFLPFLQSRSLPFKAALFREWWDDRLTPWWHFVPLDLRGQGLWATLAYFVGLDGRIGGRQVAWEAHAAQGANIAERGKTWAEKVLRKEDMEIYFFRLLLEWGRLTDDNRDVIGYGAKAG